MGLKTLLVWGAGKGRGFSGAGTKLIIHNLRTSGVDVKWEWEIFDYQETDRHLIPQDCELVVILKDFMGHAQTTPIAEQAKKRNIPVIQAPHRWSLIANDAQMRKYLSNEVLPMGATPDKAPEALVIGGKLEDRAEIQSRLLHFGWRVREHWLSNEGGHVYNKARNGIQLVVVLRDFMDNVQYQQANTLADLSKVPIVRWDINRELFRQRLARLNLLFPPVGFKPPEPPPPPPPPDEMPVALATPNEQPAFVERRTVTATSSIDSLLAASKSIADELHTNPLFNGVVIQILENGSIEIQPVARKRIIKGDGEIIPSAVTEKVQTLPSLPRPVEMPAPPKIEPLPEKPAKPIIIPVGKRGKGHLKGAKLNMECRFPGCKARSGGPRYGFFCKPHQHLPENKKKEYQQLFNASHINP